MKAHLQRKNNCEIQQMMFKLQADLIYQQFYILFRFYTRYIVCTYIIRTLLCQYTYMHTHKLTRTHIIIYSMHMFWIHYNRDCPHFSWFCLLLTICSKYKPLFLLFTLQYVKICFPGLLLSISMYTLLFFFFFFFLFLYGNDENLFDSCNDVLGTQSVLAF